MWLGWRRFAIACAGVAWLSACGSTSNSKNASNAPVWPGFVVLGALGDGCTAAMASNPSSAVAPLSFIPCTTGEADCEELHWAGSVTWNPGGGSDLLVFDVQFVLDTQGHAIRLLLRHHYPIGNGYGPNPYEAILYDLSSNAPLAVLRNLGVQSGSNSTDFSSSPSDCFVVPVASPHGLWLAGATASGQTLAAYLAVPGGSLPPPFHPAGVDTSFLNNASIALDDRLALSQDDGKIVVDRASGSNASVYGPGQRVWLSGIVGDDVLTVNDKASGGNHYFRLDPSMQFTPYGGTDQLSSDGVHVAFWRQTTTAIEAWSVSASDGTSNATMLASIPVPAYPSEVAYFGSAIADGKYALLTQAQSVAGPGTGVVTATDIDLASMSVTSGMVLPADMADGPMFSGYRQLVAYGQGYLWFTETGDQGVAKLLRFKAP